MTLRRIVSLAVPALGVLAAEPIYLLADTAIVGRLGTIPLAGLAVGVLILSTLSTQLTFLSYGTTSRSSRKYGAGNYRGAIDEGVQATWLALIVGVVLSGAIAGGAHPLASLITSNTIAADDAARWLRITGWGVPFILISLAGNGWLRGVQRTITPLVISSLGVGISLLMCVLLVPRMGLVGSAYANLVGQTVAGTGFLGAVIWAARGRLTVRPSVIWSQLILARDLVVRSLSFQICFISAGFVAGHFGAASVAAHQIVLQLWTFVTLVLDSLAIAAQTLVGEALGGGALRRARPMSWRIMWYSFGVAMGIGVAFAAGRHFIWAAFTSSVAVQEQMGGPWWIFVLLIPVGGVVFALDGVLLGSADAQFLRTATLASALIGFLPMIWLSFVYNWGLTGIWWGLAAFMVLRMVTVVWRMRTDHWLVSGAQR